MGVSKLSKNVIAYRIGHHSNEYPIFDSGGSIIYPGRWNRKNKVIYAASNYSLALLEKLVHCNTGLVPKNQQWIEITIPSATSYETITTYSFPDWNVEKETQKYGDEWLESKRTCIMFVPSIIARVENNILINDEHPEFGNIGASLHQPVVWDERLSIAFSNDGLIGETNYLSFIQRFNRWQQKHSSRRTSNKHFR